MSSTNKTPNLELSQFLANDIPSWLGDYNGDMLKIDTGLAAAAAEASGAQGAATSAASAAQAAQNTANQAVTSAQANAEDLTELKAALTNTVDEMTILGNQKSSSTCTISYSDYIVTFKVYSAWASLPNNTSISGDRTRIPLFTIPGNIFKIAASTITDNNSKIYCGYCNLRYNTASDRDVVYLAQINAYYDGSNTILYWNANTDNYNEYTLTQSLWGNLTVMFSGKFVNIATN